MARDSMSELITALRAKVNDGASEIWTGDELQQYLDMHRIHVRRELLAKEVDEKIFYSKYQLLEGTYADSTDSGATWDDDNTIIKMWGSDGASATAVSPDHWNLIDGVFWFDSDQNDDYYLDARSYDLEGAIAECLEQLAMDPTKAKVWSRGGVAYTHYDIMEMAKYHRGLSGLQSTALVRTYRKG